MKQTKSLPTLVVLSGGASSRLWPLKEKSLLKFGNDTLLGRQLKKYQKLGFKKVIIVANPNNIKDTSNSLSEIKDMDINIVVQENPNGMGDALLQIESKLSKSPETIYVTQVHDVVENNLHTDMIEGWRKNPEFSYLAGNKRSEYFPGAYLVVDETGTISKIVEKPGPENKPSNLVNIVAHIHTDAHRLLESIKTEYRKDIPSDDHYERAMDALMKDSIFKVVRYKGHWSALKYPWHVLDIMDFYLSQISETHISSRASIDDSVVIEGNVIICSGASIGKNTKIFGPAYIGQNTKIENCVVEKSMILSRCEINSNSQIVKSYVADGCEISSSIIIDSVFSSKVNFQSSSIQNLKNNDSNITSNIKGQTVDSGRISLGAIIGQGANIKQGVKLMPGVKIGPELSVGPHLSVSEDIREN